MNGTILQNYLAERLFLYTSWASSALLDSRGTVDQALLTNAPRSYFVRPIPCVAAAAHRQKAR